MYWQYMRQVTAQLASFFIPVVAASVMSHPFAACRTFEEPGPSSPTSARRTTLYDGQRAPAPAAASSVPAASHVTRTAPTQAAVLAP